VVFMILFYCKSCYTTNGVSYYVLHTGWRLRRRWRSVQLNTGAIWSSPPVDLHIVINCHHCQSSIAWNTREYSTVLFDVLIMQHIHTAFIRGISSIMLVVAVSPMYRTACGTCLHCVPLSKTIIVLWNVYDYILCPCICCSSCIIVWMHS